MRDSQGEALLFTEDAWEQLARNDYPFPDRMLHCLTRLRAAAEAWRTERGQISRRLRDWMHEEFGIEIALHGAGLANPSFQFQGQEYRGEPHVKVDDFKDPAQCGRIYFAIDSEQLRFIVCYVGLHP
jgi:hypothetical protein